MRLATVILAVLALAGSVRAAATNARIAYVHDGELIVLDVATGASRVVMRNAPEGPVAWSGDGRLVSDGGRIANGPRLPAQQLAWAQEGETAAYLSRPNGGAVRLWTPQGGSRTILPASWGARSLAWGPGGRLAIGRKVAPFNTPHPHEEVWVWQAGALRRVVGPITVDTTPIVEGFAPDGAVLWWNDLDDSASIAADGLTLFANRTPLAKTLVFADFVHVCGAYLVYAKGVDRYTTRGKSIVYDGRDVSHDTTLSWVSPSCGDGEVVASAGRNYAEPRIGSGELRSIWELVPARKRLTHPPTGWTDEDPTVLPDGSVVFVRTRETFSGSETTTLHASLDVWSGGSVKPLASLTTTVDETTSTWTPNYFGHYGWPSIVAVAP